MRNVILVLGMHRGGTSAAAGFFVKLGGAQPKTVMPAEPKNERGYFESQALMTFHDELLASAGSSWTDWRQFNPAWYQSPAAIAFQERAKQLFEEEFAGEPLSVFKDPRVCRFAPFWLEILAGIEAPARVVIPIRAPLEVALSMRERNGFSLAAGALLWLRHIIDAEIATRALPRSIFGWDQLLRDWRSVAEKASKELGLPWPRLSDATALEIENFIGYDLVHHRVSAPECAAHPDIHEWTMSAYDAMLELAHEPQSSSALKTLDEIRDPFNRASRMFGHTVIEDVIRGQDMLRKAAKLAAERDHWSRQHDAARAELAEALQAKEQILLELRARARAASDFAQALAGLGRQPEQTELAPAAEKGLNVQLVTGSDGGPAGLAGARASNQRHGRTISHGNREEKLAMTGFVDVYEPTLIGGLAWDREHPEAFVDVEILRDGMSLARTTANVNRSDLSESKLFGAHGFWFMLETPIENVDKIEVRIIGSDVYLSGIQERIRVPTSDLRHLVVGGGTIQQFLATGAADLRSIKTLLDGASFELKSGSRVLDWGCGCGRIARHWKRHAGDIDLYGCDINDQLVTWCKDNIPFGSFTRSELIPPLPYPDNYFDLLYGISVLTHLLFDTQYLWMAEIWRLLKPGGIAILTAHGPSMFPNIAKSIAGSVVKTESTLVDAGIFSSLESGEGSNQTWSIVTADVLSKIFYPFKILNYRPCYGLMGIHDTYVFAKKSSAALQFMPSLLECEMQGSAFERRMDVTKTSLRQCAVLASAKNLMHPATIQLSLHFPNSDMLSVASRLVSLPEKVSWTNLQAAYALVAIEEIPEWDGPAILSVVVKGSQPLNGVVLQLRNCMFL